MYFQSAKSLDATVNGQLTNIIPYGTPSSCGEYLGRTYIFNNLTSGDTFGFRLGGYHQDALKALQYEKKKKKHQKK